MQKTAQYLLPIYVSSLVISQEVKGDKETYLTNCKNNYSESVTAAHILFRKYYSTSNEQNNYSQFVEASIESKRQGDILSERKALEMLAEQNVGIPGVYNRLPTIYSRINEFEKAQSICNKWLRVIMG